MGSFRLAGAGLAAALALAGAADAHAQNVPTRVRGEIAGVMGNMLYIRGLDGQPVTVKLTDDWVLLVVSPVTLSSIKKGSYIGTAAVPDKGDTLRALQVTVIPEAARGFGDGHYPWDLAPQSTMTNANVSGISQKAGAETLMLDYKGGSKTVIVPKGVPITTFAPGDRTMATTGAMTVTFGQKAPDGTITAKFVSIGKDGMLPPN
ncbi:MAG TPA: hypothetical protein VEU47_03145 [Candidatus Cybelea sp.]|nr:hypothetical protein [Candidatus Cybelea sp.]